jgi:DNA polymerase-1
MKLTLDEALKAPEVLSIDFETPSLDWWTERALLVGIYAPTFEGHINLFEYNDETLALFFRDFVKNRSFVFHNAKFDLHFMERWVNVHPIPFSDTMILAYMYQEKMHNGLESLSLRYFGSDACVAKQAVDDFNKKFFKKKADIRFDKVPPDLLGARGVEDAKNTFKLFEILRPKVYSEEIYLLEKKLVKILLRMENNGVLIDVPYLQELDKKLDRSILEFKNKYSHINLNSTKQLVQWLFEDLKLEPSELTAKGSPSTKTSALKLINSPETKDLIGFREIDKLKSAFTTNLLAKVDVNKKIHADFKQVGTETGRLSCVKPNLQQIPSKSPVIRKAFLGNEALWSFDYSQMEAILYAVYNKEKFLINAVENGKDVYTAMASKVFETPYAEVTKPIRDKTKTIFLGLMYGMGKAKFERITKTTFEKVYGYFNKKPLQRKINKQIETEGFVETMFGRRRHLTPEESYKGINTIIQGSSADIIKMAMVDIPYSIQDKMRLTVHDELVFEDLTKEEGKEVWKTMTSYIPQLKVTVGSAKTWWDCKDNEAAGEEYFK